MAETRRYKLLHSVAYIDGVKYDSKDRKRRICTSDKDLIALFPNKWVQVDAHGREIYTGDGEDFEDDDMYDTSPAAVSGKEKAKAEKQKKKAYKELREEVKESEEAEETETEEEEVSGPGEDVTEEFPKANAADLKVFVVDNKYSVYDADNLEEPLKGGSGLSKQELAKLLKKKVG